MKLLEVVQEVSIALSSRWIDLDDIYGYKTNKEMFITGLKIILTLTRMIWEFGDKIILIGCMFLMLVKIKIETKYSKAVRDDGKTKYIDITNG